MQKLQLMSFFSAQGKRAIEYWKDNAWSDESLFLLPHADDQVRIWLKKSLNLRIQPALYQQFRLVMV